MKDSLSQCSRDTGGEELQKFIAYGPGQTLPGRAGQGRAGQGRQVLQGTECNTTLSLMQSVSTGLSSVLTEVQARSESHMQEGKGRQPVASGQNPQKRIKDPLAINNIQVLGQPR